MVRKQTNGRHSIRRAGAKGAPKSKHTIKAKPAKSAEFKAAKPAFGRRSSGAHAASHGSKKEGGGALGFLRRLNPF